MKNQKPFILPRLVNVELKGFSLYSLKKNISVELSQGVLCLVGANGLGKSTFLAALNYGITGIVRNPRKSFSSTMEIIKFNKGYSSQYFEGRISESDREAAEVTIELDVGDFKYEVTRGIFEPDSLRNLTITEISSGRVIFQKDEVISDEKLKQEYEKRITSHVGLNRFDQFIFLQLFVFTFDESRYLIFWDRNAVTQAISLAIGADPKWSEELDSVRRKMERADSLARNRGYQASGVRKRIDLFIEEYEKVSEEKDEDENDLSDDLQVVYEQLNEDVREKQRFYETNEEKLSGLKLSWFNKSYELKKLEDQYGQEFSERLSSKRHVNRHPLIVLTLRDEICGICGSEGKNIVETVNNAIENGKCPLCESDLPLTDGSTDSRLATLKEIDQSILEVKADLNDLSKSLERVENELELSKRVLAKAKDDYLKFEKENEDFITKIQNRSLSEKVTNEYKEDSVQQIIENLRHEMEVLLKEKKEKYEERDKHAKKLAEIQRELEERFYETEEHFVPLFAKLAKLFIGIDLNIRFVPSKSKVTPVSSFVLELKNQERREDYQLSESQRFFIDIALRMAIAQYIAAPDGQSTLFVDTPEGSLDIAYEARVGKMFSDFVKDGHNIVMTANINTSKVLTRLAEECGQEKMQLQKMTSWTQLSDVQMQEERLFSEAFYEIETLLERK